MKLSKKVFWVVVGLTLAAGVVVLIRILTGQWSKIGGDLQKSAHDIAKIKVKALEEKREELKTKLGDNDQKVLTLDGQIKVTEKKRETARLKMEGKSDEEVIAALNDLGY